MRIRFDHTDTHTSPLHTSRGRCTRPDRSFYGNEVLPSGAKVRNARSSGGLRRWGDDEGLGAM